METADLWLGVAWKVASIVGLVGTVVVSILLVRMKAEFATLVITEKQAALIDALDTRATKIESALQSTPNKEDLQKILTMLEKVSGDQRVTTERIGRVADAEERTEARLGRIEQYMLDNKL